MDIFSAILDPINPNTILRTQQRAYPQPAVQIPIILTAQDVSEPECDGDSPKMSQADEAFKWCMVAVIILIILLPFALLIESWIKKRRDAQNQATRQDLELRMY